MSMTAMFLVVGGVTVGLVALGISAAWLAGKGRDSIEPDAPAGRGTFQTLFLPRFSDAADARLTSRQVGKLCVLLSLVYLLFVAWGSRGVEALADSVVFAVIGIGLFKCSRVAAVAGLAVYVGEQIWTILSGVTPNPFSVVYVLAFLSGIRAAYAYHRLR